MFNPLKPSTQGLTGSKARGIRVPQVLQASGAAENQQCLQQWRPCAESGDCIFGRAVVQSWGGGGVYYAVIMPPPMFVRVIWLFGLRAVLDTGGSLYLETDGMNSLGSGYRNKTTLTASLAGLSKVTTTY